MLLRLAHLLAKESMEAFISKSTEFFTSLCALGFTTGESYSSNVYLSNGRIQSPITIQWYNIVDIVTI